MRAPEYTYLNFPKVIWQVCRVVPTPMDAIAYLSAVKPRLLCLRILREETGGAAGVTFRAVRRWSICAKSAGQKGERAFPNGECNPDVCGARHAVR